MNAVYGERVLKPIDRNTNKKYLNLKEIKIVCERISRYGYFFLTYGSKNNVFGSFSIKPGEDNDTVDFFTRLRCNEKLAWVVNGKKCYKMQYSYFDNRFH